LGGSFAPLSMLAYRAPAYAGVGGIGGALASALLQGLQAPNSAAVLVTAVACPAPGAWLILEGPPPPVTLPLAAGLGALLLILSFVLGVIHYRGLELIRFGLPLAFGPSSQC